MSKAEYWQRGESIDYKNTGSSAIEANSVIVLGKRDGVAGMTIQAGETDSRKMPARSRQGQRCMSLRQAR